MHSILLNNLLAIIVVWGATAYNYINTGMSIALIAFFMFLIYSFFRGQLLKQIHVDRCILLAMGAVYGLLMITTLFHLDNIKNLYGGWYCEVGFILYTLPLWMIIYIGWDCDIRKSIVTTFTMISYIMCGYGIYQCLVLKVGRLYSFYTSPTHVGITLDMFIPFTISLFCYYWESKLMRIYLLVLIFLEMIALYLTETRGSLLALSVALISVVIVAFFKCGQRISMMRKVYIVIASALFISIAGFYSVSLGIGNQHRMWGEERLLMWETSYRMWENNKIVGIGLDEWKSAYEGIYRPAESREVGKLTMPHNMIFYFLATSGIIGTIGYILYCIFMFKYFWKNISEFIKNPFSWGMFAIFMAFIAHGMVDATFISKTMSRMFFLFLGISILFERWEKGCK